MFEQRRGAPKAYAGYGAPAGGTRRFHIEGVKLTKWSERRRLKKLELRGEVVSKYWNLFFGVTVDDADDAFEPPVVQRPAQAARAAPFVERRDPDNVAEDGAVIPRRRASDWRQEDATPTADRIRARMMADAEEAELAEDEDEALSEEDLEEEADFETEDDIEDEDEDDYEAEAEEVEAEEDDTFDTEEDEEPEDEADEAIDAETDDEYEDDAEADEDDGASEEPTEDEPPRIRQRFARR